MATSLLSRNSFGLLCFLFLLCFSKRSYAFRAEPTNLEIKDLHQTHTLHITSLLPSSVCKSTAKVTDEKSKILPIIDKHGPCSRLSQDKASKVPSHAEFLRQDQARADSIHSMLSPSSMPKTRLQSEPGISSGAGKYQVSVGFGSPKKQLSLVFDTTSQLTWTQCQPCAGYCYDQNDPIFNPSDSSSFTYVSCPSGTCNRVSSQGMRQGCNSSSICVYSVKNTNTTYSIGYLSKETLTLTSSGVFQDFLFGCGQRNNLITDGGAAGILGLGRGWFSLVFQTANKYRRVFSYCFPSSDRSSGYLKFGDDNLPSSIKFMPMSHSFDGTRYYGLDMVDIGVGGQRLNIDRSVFANSGTIIDSASLVTRIPPSSYKSLRRSFLAKMTNYPTAPKMESLGICFDFSGNSKVTVPTITLYFDGGVEMPIDPKGILYFNKISQVCVAIGENGSDDDVTIIGNFQQKGYEVVFDDANGRVGFAPGRCG